MGVPAVAVVDTMVVVVDTRVVAGVDNFHIVVVVVVAAVAVAERPRVEDIRPPVAVEGAFFRRDPLDDLEEAVPKSQDWYRYYTHAAEKDTPEVPTKEAAAAGLVEMNDDDWVVVVVSEDEEARKEARPRLGEAAPHQAVGELRDTGVGGVAGAAVEVRQNREPEPTSVAAEERQIQPHPREVDPEVVVAVAAEPQTWVAEVEDEDNRTFDLIAVCSTRWNE